MSSPDEEKYASKTRQSDANEKHLQLEDANLVFCSQTQTYYYDPSSGLAKSDNLLTNIRNHLAKSGKVELIDFMLSQNIQKLLSMPDVSSRGGAKYLFNARVEFFMDVLEQMDGIHKQLKYELWSWMATNVHALCWATDTNNSDEDVIPYNCIPSLHCIFNSGMNFDMSSLIYTMDFFGTLNTANRTISTKKKKMAIGKKECIEKLLFLFNKVLPNRCAVRDFLSVLTNTIKESNFVKETFRRIILVGLIGGYEICDIRADFNTLSVILKHMDMDCDWVSWVTGAVDTQSRCDRQCLLIWIVREYLYNCILDMPSVKMAIGNTHALFTMERSVSVMDTCRNCIIDNLKTGTIDTMFSNLKLQDHLEVVVPDTANGQKTARHHQPQNHMQSEMSLNAWKLQALANALQNYPFEDILSNDELRNVISYTIGNEDMDVHHCSIAENAQMYYNAKKLIGVSKAFVAGNLNIEINSETIDKIAKSLFGAINTRKSAFKVHIKKYMQSRSKQHAIFNLVVFVCCKQILCSVNNHICSCKHRSDYKIDQKDTRKYIQFCPWCNRWQCLYSNVPYKKASPLLGRFAIDTENRLHCSASDSTKQSFFSNVKSSKDTTAEFDETEMHNEAVNVDKDETHKFRLCKFVAAYRIEMRNLAIVSNRWMVQECSQCHRPYVREFTEPSWPRFMCEFCCKSKVTKQDKKCEICMKAYRDKTNDDSLMPFVFDNYNTRHSFRCINACVHCSTRLFNRRRYQNCTLSSSVAMAAVNGTY